LAQVSCKPIWRAPSQSYNEAMQVLARVALVAVSATGVELRTHTSPQNEPEGMSEIDADHDGRISQTEARNFAKLAGVDVKSLMAEFFHFDVDHSGSLDANEVRHLFNGAASNAGELENANSAADTSDTPASPSGGVPPVASWVSSALAPHQDVRSSGEGSPPKTPAVDPTPDPEMTPDEPAISLARNFSQRVSVELSEFETSRVKVQSLDDAVQAARKNVADLVSSFSTPKVGADAQVLVNAENEALRLETQRDMARAAMRAHRSAAKDFLAVVERSGGL